MIILTIAVALALIPVFLVVSVFRYEIKQFITRNPRTNDFKILGISRPKSLTPSEICSTGIVNIDIDTGHATSETRLQWGEILKANAVQEDLATIQWWHETRQIVTTMNLDQIIENKERFKRIVEQTNDMYFNKFRKEQERAKNLDFYGD